MKETQPKPEPKPPQGKWLKGRDPRGASGGAPAAPELLHGLHSVSWDPPSTCQVSHLLAPGPYMTCCGPRCDRWDFLSSVPLLHRWPASLWWDRPMRHSLHRQTCVPSSLSSEFISRVYHSSHPFFPLPTFSLFSSPPSIVFGHISARSCITPYHTHPPSHPAFVIVSFSLPHYTPLSHTHTQTHTHIPANASATRAHTPFHEHHTDHPLPAPFMCIRG